MSINSRAKGKDGELEFAEYLRLAGFEARRGQQFHGGGDSPDVVTSIPGVHFEVKRVEAGNPYKWLLQAELDIVFNISRGVLVICRLSRIARTVRIGSPFSAWTILSI